MHRVARQHQTRASAKLAATEEWWEHRPGDRVHTIDGPGRVLAVHDGPFAGAEEYQIELDGGLGGGAYQPGQITKMLPTMASTDHTAAEDYPELGTLLYDRPDPASLSYTAAKTPPGWEGAQGPFEDEYGEPHVYARDIHSGAGNCVCGAGLEDDLHLQAAPGVDLPTRTASEDPVYLRFGHWPENERSYNNVTGHPEEGVSVYDLDEHGEPVDPDAGLDRWHEHDSSCGPGCDLDSWNSEYGNDTREEMEGRKSRAEHARYQGRDNKSDTAHLVKGTMVGIGHDGEPLLNHVQRVGDWIDHRHLLVPGAEPHRLARDPEDEDYEPPKVTKHADLVGQGDPGESMTASGAEDDHSGQWPPEYNNALYHRKDEPARVVASSSLPMVEAISDDRRRELRDQATDPHHYRQLLRGEIAKEREDKQRSDEFLGETFGPEMPTPHGYHPAWGGAAAPDPYGRLMSSEEGVSQDVEDTRHDRQSLQSLNHLLVTAVMDREFRFHFTAAWADVRAKAKRIRAEGGVNITHADDLMIVGNVRGDHYVYETGLQRHPGRRTSVAVYSCGCKWGAYHWGAPDDLGRFAGRMCSHALALQFEAASRGMFGRDVEVDHTPAKWVPSRVVVKYDIDDRDNIYAKASLQGIPEQSPALVAMAVLEDDHPTLPAILAATNELFGGGVVESNPGHQYIYGPTVAPNPDESPASAGPFSSGSPDNWGSITTNMLARTRIASAMQTEGFWKVLAESLMGEEGAEAALHPEPEGALPETDGGLHTATSDEGRDEDYTPEERDLSPLVGSLGDVEMTEHTPDTIGGNTPDAGDLEPEDQSIMTHGADLGGGGGIGSIEGLDPEELGSPEAVNVMDRVGSVTDIVAEFQKSAGAQNLMGGGSSQGSGVHDDIAGAAQAYLEKTAAQFSAVERHELIEESPGTQAANTDRLDIEGTHYALLGSEADDEGWLD
jgi:hypothetical protein